MKISAQQVYLKNCFLYFCTLKRILLLGAESAIYAYPICSSTNPFLFKHKHQISKPPPFQEHISETSQLAITAPLVNPPQHKHNSSRRKI